MVYIYFVCVYIFMSRVKCVRKRLRAINVREQDEKKRIERF